MSSRLEVVALCRKCLVGPRSAIPASHQKEALQGCPMCGLHVFSFCSWAIAIAGTLLVGLAYSVSGCVAQLQLCVYWGSGLPPPSVGVAFQGMPVLAETGCSRNQGTYWDRSIGRCWGRASGAVRVDGEYQKCLLPVLGQLGKRVRKWHMPTLPFLEKVFTDPCPPIHGLLTQAWKLVNLLSLWPWHFSNSCLCSGCWGKRVCELAL